MVFCLKNSLAHQIHTFRDKFCPAIIPLVFPFGQTAVLYFAVNVYGVWTRVILYVCMVSIALILCLNIEQWIYSIFDLL